MAAVTPAVSEVFSRRSAHVAAWLGFAAINAITILFARSGSLGARFWLSAFDFAQLAGIALAGYALMLFAKSRAWLPLAILTALALLVGATWIAADFRSFADRHERPELWRWLGAAAGVLVPLAGLVGAGFARPWLRWVAVGGTALALALNHHVLLADYRGIHLLIAWAATTCASAALVGAPLPARLAAHRQRKHLRYGLAVGVGLLSLAAFAVLPPSGVLVQAFRTEGAVLFPFLVALRGDDERVAEVAGPSQLRVAEAFLNSREKAPSIPASLPRLAPERPIVILITVDAMRAELLTKEAWRKRLPRLSRLADEGVHFTRARSPGATTRNSLGQLFASKYSAQLHWVANKKDRGAHLRDDPTPRLSTTLKEQNFATVHLATYPRLAGKYEVVGKFEHEQALKADVAGQRFVLSESVVQRALAAIDAHAHGSMFLYMHWLDAHDPYDAGGAQGELFDRYVREVELCDKSLGLLLDALEKRQLLSRTVVVLAADHGEALGDHGIPHHGQSLYEALVRVPLLVRVPGVEPRRVDVPVTTLDIAPTLFDLLGLPTPGQFMGQSLVGFLRGETPHLTRPIALDETRLKVRGLVIGPYKVIDDKRKHTVEIYDLVKDPAEANNLYGHMPEKQDEYLLGVTRSFFAKRDLKASNDDQLED